DRIKLAKGYLLQQIIEKLHMVVANLPYIASATVAQLAPEISKHEPLVALDGGIHGTGLFRDLIEQARQKLKPGGALLMEIGLGQDEEVALMGSQVFPGTEVSFIKDLQGIKRVIVMRYKTVDQGPEL
ncbi:MAG: hypothetical protein NTZ34_00760, partial [Chloroflexi bacterium]|nr:hypothetical protein [Chloroflexota bacterium]